MRLGLVALRAAARCGRVLLVLVLRGAGAVEAGAQALACPVLPLVAVRSCGWRLCLRWAGPWAAGRRGEARPAAVAEALTGRVGWACFLAVGDLAACAGCAFRCSSSSYLAFQCCASAWATSRLHCSAAARFCN